MSKFKIKPKLIFNCLVIGLCIGIVLYFIFSKDGLNDLLHSDINVVWFWIIIALISELLFMLFETLVIYVFIKDDCPSFRFTDAIKVSMMGLFWCAVTPSSTGGQPMQVYLMHSMGINVGYATSRLIQKFMVYQIVLTLINIVSVILNFSNILSLGNATLVLVLLSFGFITQIGVTAIMLLFSFKPKLSRRLIMFFAKLLNKIRIIKNVDEKIASIDKQLENFHSSNKDIYKRPKLLIPATIFTFIEFVFMFLVSYFIYRSLGFNEAGPVQIITSQAYANLVSGMVPIPGASGAAELGFAAFFSMFFINGTLKSGALIWRFINYYFVVFFTAPSAYITKGKADRKKAIEEELNS